MEYSFGILPVLLQMHSRNTDTLFLTQDVSEKRIPIMLCGNKVDLRLDLVNKGLRCVSAENGERLARDHSATFLETSSKDGNNIIDALVQLSRLFIILFDTKL